MAQPEPELKQSDTERERVKTAKRITDCIMSVLRFWKLCTYKKKPKPTLPDVVRTESQATKN